MSDSSSEYGPVVPDPFIVGQEQERPIGGIRLFDSKVDGEALRKFKLHKNNLDSSFFAQPVRVPDLGDITLLLHWDAPEDPQYDTNAIELLQPDRSMVLSNQLRDKDLHLDVNVRADHTVPPTMVTMYDPVSLSRYWGVLQTEDDAVSENEEGEKEYWGFVEVWESMEDDDKQVGIYAPIDPEKLDTLLFSFQRSSPDDALFDEEIEG